MGSCYSGDHIAGDHIHTDITRCNIDNHNRSTTLERSVIDYWHIYEIVLQDPLISPSTSVMVQPNENNYHPFNSNECSSLDNKNKLHRKKTKFNRR